MALLQVGFVWEVAQALGKALDAAATARKTDAARGGAADVLSGLAAAVVELRKTAGAPAAVPEGEIYWYDTALFTYGIRLPV